MTTKPSDPTNRDGWHVHKFGGTAWVTRIVSAVWPTYFSMSPLARQAVVVSAMSKTTDALLGLVAAAEQSAPDVSSRIDAIASRYRATVAALLKQKLGTDAVLKSFTADVADVRDVLHAISLVRQAGELEPRPHFRLRGAVVFPAASRLPG